MENSNNDFDLFLTDKELDFSLDNIEFREKLKEMFLKNAIKKENMMVPLFDDDLDSINAAMGERRGFNDKFGQGGKQQ